MKLKMPGLCCIFSFTKFLNCMGKNMYLITFICWFMWLTLFNSGVRRGRTLRFSRMMPGEHWLTIFKEQLTWDNQIFSHFLASNNLRSLANKHASFANKNVQDLYENLFFSKTCRSRSQCQTLGKEQQFVLGAAEIIAIETLIGREIKCTHCVLFQKMVISNFLFTTVSYDVGIKKITRSFILTKKVVASCKNLYA